MCVCVWRFQAVHHGVIAAPEFAARIIAVFSPGSAEHCGKTVSTIVCACMCVYLCFLALWEKCACSECGHNTVFSLLCTSISSIKLVLESVVSVSLSEAAFFFTHVVLSEQLL